MASKRQLKAKSKVTYHGEDGDRHAHIVRFDGLSRARLTFGDDPAGDNENDLFHVPEGSDPGMWTAIPPRRGTS